MMLRAARQCRLLRASRGAVGGVGSTSAIAMAARSYAAEAAASSEAGSKSTSTTVPVRQQQWHFTYKSWDHRYNRSTLGELHSAILIPASTAAVSLSWVRLEHVLMSADTESLHRPHQAHQVVRFQRETRIWYEVREAEESCRLPRHSVFRVMAPRRRCLLTESACEALQAPQVKKKRPADSACHLCRRR